MWIQKNLDIGWRDLFYGIAQCVIPRNEKALIAQNASLWKAQRNVFVCLSVRTGFDLFLRALNLPEKSEIIISALTIPDMVKIIGHNNLVAVPVDIDENMAPQLEQISKLITPATRAIVVAHLFGSRLDMDSIINTAKQHHLLVIEDCAQAFDGLSYNGHSEADMSMFSFGTIKTATALGGAVLMVKDKVILQKMDLLHSHYPLQEQQQFLVKLLKSMLMKLLSNRHLFGLAVTFCNILQYDYDYIIHKVSRSFPGSDLISQIRRRSCPALLALLHYRISNHDSKRLNIRREKGRKLYNLLQNQNWNCPAASVNKHNFWVFPVLAENPAELIAKMRNNGFDAASRHSLVIVPFKPVEVTTNVNRMLPQIVYLPFYNELPDEEIEKMAVLLSNN